MTKDEEREVAAFFKKIENQFKDAVEDINARFPEVKTFGFIDVSTRNAEVPGTAFTYVRGWANSPNDNVHPGANYDRGAPHLVDEIRKNRIP